MSFLVKVLPIIGGLFVAMLVVQGLGRRLAERHRRLDPSADRTVYGAAEGAVFALLGLFLAFTFYGAASRFDVRRELVVEEANAIGTAWLRLDLLPAERRDEIRSLFRDYLDARLEVYRRVARGEAPAEALKQSQALQQHIWDASIRATEPSQGRLQTSTVLFPALNAMFDITTTRTAAARMHPPLAVYAMVGVLSLMSALFVGYATAGRKVRSLLHTVGFAVVLTTVLYVIVDLEFPRLGLIRVDAMDEVLIQVRQSMGG